MLKFMFLGINGSLQEQHSGNTSLLISGAEGRAVVDLSCNIAAAVGADVDAVILTHEHIDHVYGLPSLLHQLWLCGRKRPLNLFCPEGMSRMVHELIDLFGIREKQDMFPIRLCEDSAFFAGSMRFLAFRTDHTAASVGIVAEDGADKLVYTCDTRPITEALPVMNGAQVLIHEACGTFMEEGTLLRKGHSSGADAGRLARMLEVKKMYLCHLPKGDKVKQEILLEARSVFQETWIPDMLQEIPVGGTEG